MTNEILICLGAVLGLLSATHLNNLQTNEEETIASIKEFVKESNIDFEKFFSEMQHFAIPNEDLFAIDSKLWNTKLSHECLLKLSANWLDQEMFATFDYIQPSYDLRGINSGDLNSTIKDFHSKFQISPKLLHKNKPDIQTKKESETKESNNEVSKPNYIQAPYNQIQIHSEDDSERISMDILSKDDPNFMIPNEGNINKSPLSLLTKATRVIYIWIKYIDKRILN